MSIDPTSEKFSKYFKSNVNYIADFFSSMFKKDLVNKKQSHYIILNVL